MIQFHELSSGWRVMAAFDEDDKMMAVILVREDKWDEFFNMTIEDDEPWKGG